MKLHAERDYLTLQALSTAKSLQEIFEAAAESDAPILIHVAFTEAEILALFEVARRVPHARIVVAHQLGPAMPLLMQAPDNVSTEISGLLMLSPEQRASIVPLWRAFGTHRILLGSDWPLLQPKKYLDALRAMPLTDEERAKITRENFARLFRTSRGENSTAASE